MTNCSLLLKKQHELLPLGIKQYYLKNILREWNLRALRLLIIKQSSSPLPPTEIVHEPHTLYFDYEQKYMPGRSTKFTPARTSPEMIKKIQELCIRATQLLEIQTISRIDGFLTKQGEIIIIDPNTFSGVAPSSFLFRQAAEINMSTTALINHLIETELDHYALLTPLNSKKKMKENRWANIKKNE